MHAVMDIPLVGWVSYLFDGGAVVILFVEWDSSLYEHYLLGFDCLRFRWREIGIWDVCTIYCLYEFSLVSLNKIHIIV